MNKIISSRAVALTFGVLAVSFLAAFYVIAWTEPSQAPPGGNVPTPLNVGATGQSKSGGLILNTGGAVNGLIVSQGKVGIGVASPEGQLEVRGEIRTTGPNVASLNCPIWKDCDNDGYTPGYRDCDESCDSCYQNATFCTAAPDGKDQNCNGTVDEVNCVNTGSCFGAISQIYGYDDSCQWVKNGKYKYFSPYDPYAGGQCPGKTCGCSSCVESQVVIGNPEGPDHLMVSGASITCSGQSWYEQVIAWSIPSNAGQCRSVMENVYR